MRALFVMPVEEGSGETVTSVQVASQLRDVGWTVAFVATTFALRFVPASMESRQWVLTGNSVDNLRTWDEALDVFRPDIVLFADYPLMHFNHGVVPLAREDGFVRRLDAVDATLVTFDHFGWARQRDPLFLGPPHLGLSVQHFEALPPQMRVLRPCPMHEPASHVDILGEPFRSCAIPLAYTAAARQRVRDTWLGPGSNRFLVFHSVPNWAWRHAERLGLRLYDALPSLLERYFGPLAERVTLISSNNGHLLSASGGTRLDIRNVGPLPVAQFEDLLYGSDLVLSENGLSISIGKAACARQIGVVFQNSFRLSELMKDADEHIAATLCYLEAKQLGAVFPFAAFPTVTPIDVEAIGLFDRNSLVHTFARLEIFGGDETAEQLQRLLVDRTAREMLHEHQDRYIESLARLDDTATIIAQLMSST